MGSRSLALILLLAAVPSLRAQDRSPKLDLAVAAEIGTRTDGPTVALSNVLAEGHRRELLNAGWPAVLHCQVEIWKKGFLTFQRDGVVAWDIVVENVAATGRYQVRRVQDGKITDLGDVATIGEAELIADRSYRVPLVPGSTGKTYYYVFRIELSTLSMTDLDAWQRWVRGEATPAVQGKGNIFTAIKRGLGAIFTRVLGGETQTYETRSRAFTAA